MKLDLSYLGIINTKNIYYNESAPKLVELSIKKEEGELSNTGALVINTGKYSGRSPDDRFIVDDDYTHSHINWGKINKPISEDIFNKLMTKLTSYFQNRDVFVFDGFVGNDNDYKVPLRIINETASHNLASRNLFIRPDEETLKNFSPEFNVINAPHFFSIPEIDNVHSEAFVILHLKKKIIIIGGTGYVGEIKKAVFSSMNFLLPFKDVFPMHCSANVDDDNNSALFFGLSGTGKTTLSADIERHLIGDDEHGWSKNGIFNFEGGCYAKVINLKEESEPEIFHAIKFGTVLENVVIDKKTKIADYTDGTFTQNTRAAYPIHHISNPVMDGKGPHPKTVLFLTADAFGVLPPISKLTPEQAMTHFVIGYTSKLAGTERGIVEPQETFSCCFGAPFMMLHPSRYAEMLKEKIQKYNTDVYLINTGWSGGPYGIGERIKLKYTRRMVKAAINHELDNIEFYKEDFFDLQIPKECPDIPSEILNPKNTWKDKKKYDETAKKLSTQFDSIIKKINFEL